MHKRTREEMIEFAISQEPGNPRFVKLTFSNHGLYDTDNRRLIDTLMALQDDMLKEDR